jgi:hypothetical protein
MRQHIRSVRKKTFQSNQFFNDHQSTLFIQKRCWVLTRVGVCGTEERLLEQLSLNLATKLGESFDMQDTSRENNDRTDNIQNQIFVTQSRQT